MNANGFDMDVWEILLYGWAAYLTLQLLMRLMETHKQRRLKELAEELRRNQTGARLAQPTEPNPVDEPNVDQNQAA